MPAGQAFSIKSRNFAYSISSQFSLFIPLKAENLWSSDVFRGWGIVVVVVERGRGGEGGGQKVTISLKWINLMSLGFIYEILFIEFIYVNYFWDEQVLKNMLINFRTFPPFFIWLPFLSSFSRWVSLSKCFYCKYYYYYYRTIEMSF